MIFKKIYFSHGLLWRGAGETIKDVTNSEGIEEIEEIGSTANLVENRCIV